MIAEFTLIHALFHPLSGAGGTFYGGIFGDATIFVSVVTAAFASVRHKNCHVKGCWRLGHTDPEHGFPACKFHHSNGDQFGNAAHDSRK